MAGADHVFLLGARLSDRVRLAMDLRWRVAARALFASSFALVDLASRGAAYAGHPRLLVDGASSVALGLFVARSARGPGLRAPVAIVHAAAMALTLLCLRYYHVPLDGQMAATAVHAWTDAGPMVLRLLPLFLLATALVAAIDYGLLAVSETPAPPPRALLVAVALGGLFGSRYSEATPELRLVDAVRVALRREAPQGRVGAAGVPPLPSRRARLPDVLFVLGESLRSADVCSATSTSCKTFPEVDSLTKSRVGLAQMRSVSSYTAVSLSALLTGRTQEGDRDALLGAPNAFDLLRAVRLGATRPQVIYASAQLESVFEAKDARAQVDVFLSAEALLGRTPSDIDEVLEEDLDGRLATELERLIPELPEPFFLLVHLVGTHAPYFVDEAMAPFRPYSRVVSFGNMPGLANAYRNSMVAQDARLARVLRAFFARVGQGPHVVLFTSDHGEAFGEHSAIHHGQNLYDEQIHVPAFLLHGGGALTREEALALEANKDAFLTHLDLLPTLLDLYGVDGAVGAGRFTSRLAGRSLLRARSAVAAPLPITNCTGMFPCPVNTWGLLAGDRKLVMQAWDGEWRCLGLGAEEREIAPFDAPCEQLREASRGVYPVKPNRDPNR